MNELHKKGLFIAVEGIDGSGKSTQIRLLKNRLKNIGIRCYETREPTDSPVGSLIRQILTGRIEADNKVIAGLFIADRTDHLLNKTNGLCQKIDAGVTVLTDRYYFSSYAYQSIDVDMDWIINANSINANILRPTVTIFLDISARQAMERINRERFHTELFEKEDRLNIVREKYFEAFAKLEAQEKVVIIDAGLDVETVSEQIWASVAAYF